MVMTGTDADNPVERKLILLRLFLMAGQMNHFLLVFAGEITSPGHNTSREIVIDAATGRTQFFGSIPGPRHPPPAPLMIDSTALRADHTFMQLPLVLARIKDVILLAASQNAACRSWPLRRQAACLHLASLASFSSPDAPGNAVGSSGMPSRFSALT
jgi:hypothetical protein